MNKIIFAIIAMTILSACSRETTPTTPVQPPTVAPTTEPLNQDLAK